MMFHVLGYSVLLLLWVCCDAQNDDCGPPPRRNNEELANLSDKQTYSHGEVVLYNCRPGFIKLGRIRVRCNNGNWEKLPPSVECRKRPCGHPGDIEFGSFELVNGDEFVFGARVEYQCDPGYQMLSQTNYRVCRADGWSNDVPHCEVKKCFPVKPPENGRILMSGIHGLDQDYIFGQALRFECNPKFKMVGAKQIVCADEGQWNPDVPTCKEIICTSGNIANGYITSLKDVYKEGDQLQFDCHDGYKPVDRSVAVCSENGWNTRLECTEIVCSRPEVNNGRVNPHQQQYSSEETIQIECDPGYEPERREATSKCTKNGWLPQPKCLSKRCNYPEAENVQLYRSYGTYRENYFPKREGEYIYFGCSNGFLPANKENRWILTSCTKSGWDPEPKCFKQCELKGFSRGSFIHGYWQTFIEGNEISFSCQRGYYPEPQEAKTKCTKNGWLPTPICTSREIPTCKSDPPANGYFTVRKVRFALNEITRYRCHIGFTTREGHEEGESRCLREGWTPKPECVQTCQKPTDGNVIISITKQVFVLEENLPYKCADGYETITKALKDSSKCTVNGWSPKPQCLPIQCEVLDLDNGEVKPRKDQYLYSDIVQFSCRPGRIRVGPISAQCYHFGWSPPPPICKAAGKINSCQPPSNITDGIIITAVQEEYQHGQQVEYECNLKYAMTGSKKIECVDGQWTSLPSCTAAGKINSCQPPSNITDGIIITAVQEEYQHGQQVEYECNLKYAMTGSKKIECVDGQWTSLPSCTEERRTCGPPPRIDNGHALSRGRKNYFHGNTVRYECAEGFSVVGTNPGKCLHGHWDFPSCTALDLLDGCARPEIPKNTNTDSLKRHYNNNEVVSYRCDSSQHITKCVKGNWSPKPDCRELCSPPPQPPNATKIIEVRNFENGEKIRFACQENFLLEGPQEILCEDGRWGKPPRCIDASCGNPPTIANGASVNGTQGRYLPGSKVEYHCNEGFNISEIRFSTCKNRSWTTMPDCKEKPCGRPPQIFDASFSSREKAIYQPGEIVHYMCHPGFAADGPLNVTCRKGQWTEPPICEDAACGEPPTITNADIISGRRAVYKPDHHVQYRCHAGFEMSGSDNVTCGIKVWSKPPTCEDVTCPPPTEIAHGEIVGQPKERYMPSERVRYQCDPGWNPSGPMVVTCFNKQWTKLPRCIDPKANCGPPPGIQNGDFLNPAQASYPPGTTLRYQCQNLYVMNGSSEVRCENGHWTETPTCIEACTVSEEDMARNNIWLKWRSDPKLYSQSGDTMEFRCIWNHREAPLSPPFRTQCIQGNVEYPRCIPVH